MSADEDKAVMGMSIHLDIVSAESEIYSGLVESVTVAGVMGDLGIMPGHAPLLSAIEAGPVRIVRQGGEEEIFFISGGFIEVQPSLVTILADAASRAADLDEAAAIQAKERAQADVNAHRSEMEYSQALVDLAHAAAELRAIQKLRKTAGRRG